MRYTIIGSLAVSIPIFLFVAFFLRCYPLGCHLWDIGEIGKIFAYVFIPVFFISEIIMRVYKARHAKNNKR